MKDLPDAFERIAAGAATHADIGPHAGGAERPGGGSPSDALALLVAETGRRRRRFVATTLVAGAAAVGLVVAGGAAVLHRTELPPVGPVVTSPNPPATPTADPSNDAGSWLGCGADTAGLQPVTVDGLTATASLSTYGAEDGELWLGATVTNDGTTGVPRGGTDELHWVAVQDGRVVADGGATVPATAHTLEPGGYDGLDPEAGLSALTDCRTGAPVTGPYDLWLRADLATTADSGTAGAGTITLVAEPLWATDDPAPVPAAIPIVGDGGHLGPDDRVMVERQTGPAQWDVVVSVGGAVRDAYPTIRSALLAAGFTAQDEQTDRRRPAWTFGRFAGPGYTVDVDVSNETGGDTFAQWTVTSDRDGSKPGAETGWTPVEPPPPSARETALLDVAARAGVTDAGPAEHNVGDTATVSGSWQGQEALLWIMGPSTGSVWTVRDPVDLDGVPGSSAEDSAGRLGVQFACGGVTYAVQVQEPADPQTTDLPAAVDLATAMAHAAC